MPHSYLPSVALLAYYTHMKVSLIKIIKSDYIALASLIAPIVSIILYVDAKYFGVLQQYLRSGEMKEPLGSLLFLGIFIASILIFVPVLYFRIKNIQTHFQNGIEVKGQIVYVNLWKDRGRIEYIYEINGETYKAGTAVHRSKFVDSLTEGQVVDIIVSAKNPKKALIKDMYVSS